MKSYVICPACSNNAYLYDLDTPHYTCKACGWDSDVNTFDIAYKDNNTAVLSNLFPHAFVIDGVKCASMESFIQSLREEKVEVQKTICSDYSGMMAHKMKLCLRDWRPSGIVFWQGKPINRFSNEYTELMTRAYDCLFEQSILFKEILFRKRHFHLIHSMGCDDIHETLLTEKEYRFQLNRLITRLE